MDDVYRKFGEVSEVAQLLETDLGTALLFLGAVDEGLISPTLEVDRVGARDLMNRIERQTLGQLIRSTRRLSEAFEPIETLLADALDKRNRLAHSFYLDHNVRNQSDAGRGIMVADLEAMHDTMLKAWKAVNLVSGIDIEVIGCQIEERGEAAAVAQDAPLQHLPIGPRRQS